jgi:hypothetical protein
MIPEDTISFILTFMSYNQATQDSEGIIIDKIIESEFFGGRKMVVEFETPVILTQKQE